MTEQKSVDLFTQLLDRTQSIDAAIAIWVAGSFLISLLLYLIARLFVGLLVRKKVAGYRTLRRMRGPLILAAVLVWLRLAAPAGDFAPAVYEILGHISYIGVILLCGWAAIIAISASAAYFTRINSSDQGDVLQARRYQTQVSILKRAGEIIVVLVTLAGVLMTFPAVRHIGISMFASAGVAGLALGLAARPILSNLIAGIQIAITQPMRLDDTVIVEGEWGWIEEITATYVVVRIWDLRRLIVPLSHFIEKPFENWTRKDPELLGQVTWHVDYRAPLDAMRVKLAEIVEKDPAWDRKTASVQVVDANHATISVRALVSARNSTDCWNLRCSVREKMITWLKDEYPGALPRVRAEVAVPPLGERTIAPGGAIAAAQR